MGRVFILLAYKGTNFFGWQIQPNQISVQEVIEKVLSKMNGDKEVKVVGCGRTDRGVHAAEFYAHADIPFEIGPQQLVFKLNSMLPSDIAIKTVVEVAAQAHARFDALERTYHYFIHQQKDPFVDSISWLKKIELDLGLMNKACLILIDHKNFQCFSKVSSEVSSFNCEISKALWIKSDKGYIFSITANRFLRNMVRAIVGTMIEIGAKSLSLDQFQAVLDSKNRSEAGQSVPARGLFLAKVTYPYIQS